VNRAFQELVESPGVLALCSEDSRLAVAPALGGRVFAEIAGVCPHRMRLSRCPAEPFGNYGGNTFWPAPEGGCFGLNYRGDEWYVQPAIDEEPFALVAHEDGRCGLEKTAELTNRGGVRLSTVMKREVWLSALPSLLDGCRFKSSLAYTVRDSIRVENTVPVSDALIAAWTLEQFAASADTVSFCAVCKPEEAVNFHYYAHPGQRISCVSRGLLYRTDGQSRGQIGIRLSSEPACIGFYDLSRRLLCIRRNANAGRGQYFNIADNAQPDGPYSAADVYSIFNSDASMAAFELETVGGADVEDTRLTGSVLESETCFAVFEDVRELQGFLMEQIGGFI